MDKNINIIKTKANIIEFDLDIEGVEANDEKVNFVIEAKEYDFSIPCKKLGGKKWSVTIPEMDSLETTLYKFHIDVITSGYHFMPFEGTLNVIKSAELYVKNIENKSVKSTATEKPKDSTTEKPKTEVQKTAKKIAPKSKLPSVIKSEIDKITTDKPIEVKKEEEETTQKKAPELKLMKSEINKIADDKKSKISAPKKKVKSEIDKIASEIVKDSIKKDSKAKAPAPKKVKTEIEKLANKITKEVDKAEKPIFKKVDAEPEELKSELNKIAKDITKDEPITIGGYKVSKLDEKVLDILSTVEKPKPSASVKFKKGGIAEV